MVPRVTYIVMFLWQGALDVRFLAARFAKGKQWIEGYMQKHHVYYGMPANESHTQLLAFLQSAEVADPLLALTRVRQCHAQMFLLALICEM